MKTPAGLTSLSRVILAAAIFFFAGCDSSTVNEDSATLTASTGEDLTSVVASDLSLTDDQRAQMRAFIEGSGDLAKEPGFSWRLAARLQSTLTAEQKARLLEQAASAPEDHGFGERNGRNGPFGTPQSGLPGGHGGSGRLGDHGAGGLLAEILTDEQKEQVKAIRESYRDDLEALRNQVSSGEITRAEAQEQLRTILDAIRSEVEALLTDEQRAQLEQLRAEREAEREARREEAALVRDEVLGLDAAQSDALDAILTEFRESVSATLEQLRSEDADRDQIHAAIQELKQARDTKAAELLDATAFEIFQIHDALRHRLRGHGMRRGGHDGGPRGGGSHGPGGADMFGSWG